MIIVDHGCIAGGETIALRDAGIRLRIVLAAPRCDLKDFLTGQGVEIALADDSRALVSLAGGVPERATLLAALIGAGFAVSEYAQDTHALEDVYFARVNAPAGAAKS
jgi:hypothetical protein